MKTNLVDRDLYKLPQDSKDTVNDLKKKMSDKLKFVLSDKKDFDPYFGKKKVSKPIVVPNQFSKLIQDESRLSLIKTKSEDDYKKLVITFP